MRSEWKQKIAKKYFERFWQWLQKRIYPEKFWSEREETLLESQENYEKLEDDKHTPQWVTLRPHLLNVQNVVWKNTLPLHWRLWVQVQSQVVSVRHEPEIQKKLFDRLDTKKC